MFARSNEPEVDGGGGGGVVYKEVERSVGKQAIPMARRAILASGGYSSREIILCTKMAVINCGRVGCQFPIKSDRIVCCKCSTAFHPECSDLCPEDYATKCGRGDWYCAICTAATTPIGDCGIGVATAKRADTAPPPHLLPISYLTSNPNKLRETMEIGNG
ncbi:hypothetical protein EmuJ_000567600 [Echinococcus multilocularis]|uniref:PHD-type domain-containing protein n=1 Tax=Echinococcus multilocularis TaxID=6211 RepID=A0A068Y518_ECHMU|nr:hypothetical protein EmuJ_000567600 [Echinococcus multilocularis]